MAAGRRFMPAASSRAGGSAANSIAKWDGSNWTPLGSGMNASVFALTAFDDGGGSSLYAGGFFTSAGGTAANSIADGTARAGLLLGAEWAV
jgi:hypothetical protein